MFTNPLLKENEELKQRLAETLVRIIDLERALEAANPSFTQDPPSLRTAPPVEDPLGLATTSGYLAYH